jgi:hypothetical protein
VEKRLYYNDYSGKLFINIPKGVQVLDGKNALHYARFRNDALNDLGRIGRQQKLVKEVIRKLQSPAMVLKLPELISEATKMVNTDMTPLQAIQLALYLKDISISDLKLFTAPGKPSQNTVYWELDKQEMSRLLAEEFDSDSSKDTVAQNETEADLPLLLSRINGKISVLNGDGSKGLVKRTSEELQRIGIDVGITGNAKHFDYRHSNIMIPNNGNQQDMESAEALAKLCGIKKEQISRNAAVTSVTVIMGKDNERILTNLRAIGSNR